FLDQCIQPVNIADHFLNITSVPQLSMSWHEGLSRKLHDPRQGSPHLIGISIWQVRMSPCEEQVGHENDSLFRQVQNRIAGCMTTAVANQMCDTTGTVEIQVVKKRYIWQSDLQLRQGFQNRSIVGDGVGCKAA